MSNNILEQKINRRSMMRAGAAFSVALTIPNWLWGCGPDEETTDNNADDVTIDPAWEGRVETFEADIPTYTSEMPGEWAGKEATHLPIVMLLAGQGSVEVSTNHEMTEEHFIAAHYIKDQDGRVIAFAEYANDPDVTPRTTFKLPSGTTKITVFSYCNKHDIWEAAATDVMG